MLLRRHRIAISTATRGIVLNRRLKVRARSGNTILRFARRIGNLLPRISDSVDDSCHTALKRVFPTLCEPELA